MLRNIRSKFMCLWSSCSKWQDLKQCLLEHREPSLILAGVLGIGFAFAIYCGTELFELGNNSNLQSGLTLLALGLPTFFILWMFRTYDVQRQLDKTQENINNSTFFECARMLMGESSQRSLHQRIALEQLAYLKNKTSFDREKIDMLTRNLNLDNSDLRNAYLENLDFCGTDLSGANLVGAKLKGAKYNNHKQLPTDINPQAAGMILVED